MLSKISRIQKLPRVLLTRRFIDLASLRAENQNVIKDLEEVKQRDLFGQQLASAGKTSTEDLEVSLFNESSMTIDQLNRLITAGLATFHLHVEARVAASIGQGFYTIGPCGEELLSTLGLLLHPTDPSALHYRHVGVAIMRQLQQGKSLNDILLDRARGFVCSQLDPVTGGRHCAIGGTSYDYIVTSTLASQCTPAVGRAQAISLTRALNIDSPFPKDAVSFVSIGDGSANNAHFLSAINLAKYSIHQKQKCPVVFAISDNGLSISLKDKGWLYELCKDILPEAGTFVVDSTSVVDIYQQSEKAIHYSRKYRQPSLLIFRGLSRRFGHAATDRQSAYLSPSEIQEAAHRNDLFGACELAVAVGATDWNALQRNFDSIRVATQEAFDTAAQEPKVTNRDMLVASNSSPLQQQQQQQQQQAATSSSDSSTGSSNNGFGKSKREGEIDLVSAADTQVISNPMRKLMTGVFEEALAGQTAAGNAVVYVGEDVRHGGYYLVTDGLAGKYPLRVHDFPPDETALVGAAWGYSQAGLAPILEIPYAKYLDCASDIFHEICITHWLTNGREAPGLVIRLQGFDRGTFGGNFHTHNSLPIPPGLDVVCYSNGHDYVRGMRYLLRQSSNAGRVCMSVDSTDLLNRRHLHPELKDGFFLHPFPSCHDTEEMNFDEIGFYVYNASQLAKCERLFDQNRPFHRQQQLQDIKLVITSYGNGLPASLIAMTQLVEDQCIQSHEVVVIDCPYLTTPPAQLTTFLADLRAATSASATATGSGDDGGSGSGSGIEPASKKKSFDGFALVLADVCKHASGAPFPSFAIRFQHSGLLPSRWRVAAAQPTYNPLGQTLTFLSSEDIYQTCLDVLD